MRSFNNKKIGQLSTKFIKTHLPDKEYVRALSDVKKRAANALIVVTQAQIFLWRASVNFAPIIPKSATTKKKTIENRVWRKDIWELKNTNRIWGFGGNVSTRENQRSCPYFQ